VSPARRPTATRRHRSADLDQALAFRIHRTNRLLRTHLGRFLDAREPGLTPEQWFLLARIADRGPLRQVDLAEPVLGDPPNVSRLVDALVERGYLRRSPEPADRRSWLISLTPDGRSRTDGLLEDAVTERQLVFEGFGEDELAALATALDRIDHNVRRLLSDRVPS
jgi:DNA-binding MarR family transcriptional regulator